MKNCFKRFVDKFRSPNEEHGEHTEGPVVPDPNESVPTELVDSPTEPEKPEEPELPMEEKKKLEAIDLINKAEGGFILVTYDIAGFCECCEGIGDNAASCCGLKLSDLIAKAQMEYINWRSRQRSRKDEPRVTEKK